MRKDITKSRRKKTKSSVNPNTHVLIGSTENWTPDSAQIKEGRIWDQLQLEVVVFYLLNKTAEKWKLRTSFAIRKWLREWACFAGHVCTCCTLVMTAETLLASKQTITVGFPPDTHQCNTSNQLCNFRDSPPRLLKWKLYWEFRSCAMLCNSYLTVSFWRWLV